MNTIIKQIEHKLYSLRNEGVGFGPDQFSIVKIVKAHNGIEGNDLGNPEDITGEGFYNGVMCVFESFSVLLINNARTTHYKEGHVFAVTNVFTQQEDIVSFLSPGLILNTVQDLVNQLPSNGIKYNIPGVTVSIKESQWQLIKSNQESAVVGGEITIKKMIEFLKAAAEAGFSIHLVDEHGNNQGYLSFDFDSKIFRVLQ